MTVSLDIPSEVEFRLTEDVRTGRHSSVEAAILERLSHDEWPDLAEVAGLKRAELRADLHVAWNDRAGAVNGETFFAGLLSRRKAR